jgi:predicted nucleic acid-binding protein
MSCPRSVAVVILTFARGPATRNTVDSLIAATARVHDLIVVTRNTDDFGGCGVPLLNPWQPQAGI